MNRYLQTLAAVALLASCVPETQYKTPEWQEPSVVPQDSTSTEIIVPADTTDVTPPTPPQPPVEDGTGTVLIIGGGSSGVCAAVQAARLGVSVILVEETPWLGGMLTSAGVSATDGNHKMRQGLFGEFADELAR